MDHALVGWDLARRRINDAPRWRAPRPGLRSHVVHLERQQLVKGHFRIKERPTVLLGVGLLMDLAMAAARAIPANPGHVRNNKLGPSGLAITTNYNKNDIYTII